MVTWMLVEADQVIGYVQILIHVGHMLNGCKKSIHKFQFRFFYVLAHLVDKMMHSKPETMGVYADLVMWRVNGGMVPSDLVSNGQIPDIVLLDRVKTTIVLLESTLPLDSSTRSGPEDNPELSRGSGL